MRNRIDPDRYSSYLGSPSVTLNAEFTRLQIGASDKDPRELIRQCKLELEKLRRSEPRKEDAPPFNLRIDSTKSRVMSMGGGIAVDTTLDVSLETELLNDLIADLKRYIRNELRTARGRQQVIERMRQHFERVLPGIEEAFPHE